MSDLLSPILYVMENEVEAFWCFVAFMDQMVSVMFALNARTLSCALIRRRVSCSTRTSRSRCRA